MSKTNVTVEQVELKPCPFCGGVAGYVQALGARCGGCGAVLPAFHAHHVTAWNTRHTSTLQAQEQIKLLREALADLEMSASRVAFKYGWDDEREEPLDWTEWENVRRDTKAARQALEATNG